MSKISVIVPVYKVEEYIRRCVDSIISQVFTDFELILVDDGSPDNCGSICDEYALKDNRIKVIHKENGGLSDARNAGIDWVFANSNSEWITFVDSDDWINYHYLQILFNAVTENNTLISSCGYIRVKDDIEINPELVPAYQITVGNSEELQINKKSYSEWNTAVSVGRLYNRRLFQNVRFPYGRYHEDEFTTYKLLFSVDSIALVRIPLYYYYANVSSIVSSEFSPKRMKDQLDAYAAQLEYFAENNFNLNFRIRFQDYCARIEMYRVRFANQHDYTKEINAHKENIELLIQKYWDCMPEELKEKGYKKWIANRDLLKEELKQDIAAIKEEKGFIYSLLWRIKNYHRYL